MGVGGFMAAAASLPMVRFALDPALKAGAETELHYICDLDDLTEEPQSFNLQYAQQDAWYESEANHTVYLFRHGEEVVALSSTCTHLGCTVAFGTNEDHPDQFFCPCHFGRFEKDGTNVPNLPPQRPLDRYEVSVEDGKVYLGSLIQNR
jgi:menaquinol-cytochrome c reductase iron-sulfur subunit